MKYEAIERYKAEFPIVRLCAVLEVSESGYYAWLKREVCVREAENASLTEQVMAIWLKLRKIYGAPRIWIN